MATTTNITNSFEGIRSKDIFISIFKQAQTFEKNLITVTFGIIGSYTLPKLSYTPEMRLSVGCGWNPTGTLSLTEKELITKKYEIASELCKEDFAKTWEAQNQGLFSAHAEIPTSIETAFLSQMTGKSAYIIDSNIWYGNNTTNTFNGLIPQFVADSTVVKITGATAVNKGNVEEKLELLVDAIDTIGMEAESDTVVVVSRNVATAYKRAQNSMGVNTTVGDKELDYMGIRLEVLDTLEKNTMLAYRVQNVHFLSGVGSDLESVEIRDLDDLSGIVRYQLKFYAGVGYQEGSEIVLYKG